MGYPVPGAVPPASSFSSTSSDGTTSGPIPQLTAARPAQQPHSILQRPHVPRQKCRTDKELAEQDAHGWIGVGIGWRRRAAAGSRMRDVAKRA